LRPVQIYQAPQDQRGEEHALAVPSLRQCIEHRSDKTAEALTEDELDMAERLACCFLRGGATDQSSTPLINIFIDFLGLSARQKGDESFFKWISEHYSSTYKSHLSRMQSS
jgi:hypothetical protein